jgi:hypothetical protein
MTSIREFSTQVGLGNPPISVRSLVAQFGTNSLQNAIAAHKIRELYLNSGAHQGLLGFPLSNVQFDTHKAEQRFAGGKIEFLHTTPKGVAETSVRARFVGFHCDRESDHDQLSDTDEPYFIIGVAGSNRSNTIRFGPYQNVETGTDRFEAVPLVMFDFNPGLEKWTTPPRIGLHGQNPYNTEITVDGGSEGAYKLRFQVEIVDTNIVVG